MHTLFIMCTFAAAKVVIALAVSYQYAEKERFMTCGKQGRLILFLSVCVENGKRDDT